MLSAGIVPFRVVGGQAQVLIVHPGGPLFAKRWEGVWSIPKGLVESNGEEWLAVAVRELYEEVGIVAQGPFIGLGIVRQNRYKEVVAWAMPYEGEVPNPPLSNTFPLEWPPGSGVVRYFPEVDRAEWHTLESARRLLVRGQVPLIERLVDRLGRLGVV